MHLLEQAAIFLLTAVLLVPLFQRLKLGAVLGYLAAGMLIGPWGLGVVGEVESTLQFAEFGVVLLLFLIGLELRARAAVGAAPHGVRPRRRAGGGDRRGAARWSRWPSAWTWQAALVVGLGLRACRPPRW